MKVRTSVTLPKELLIKVDALRDKSRNRSMIMESALTDYLAKSSPKMKLNQNDIEIINANADVINRQVEETLEFQAEW